MQAAPQDKPSDLSNKPNAISEIEYVGFSIKFLTVAKQNESLVFHADSILEESLGPEHIWINPIIFHHHRIQVNQDQCFLQIKNRNIEFCGLIRLLLCLPWELCSQTIQRIYLSCEEW